jgi:hypothetical protein
LLDHGLSGLAALPRIAAYVGDNDVSTFLGHADGDGPAES